MVFRFALAGNPNSGKTTLFNTLTGSTAHVGNWPGVTVDKKEGVYRKFKEPIAIIDLPGIYSLSPYTPEEVIARNYVLDEKPDCVINIVDATNLERNLYLTTQLMEIDVPLVIALNMTDVLEKAGDKIDYKALEVRLGVPVVPISALKSSNVDKLMEKAFEFSKIQRKGITVIEDTALTHLIGDIKIALEGHGVLNPMFHAVKLAELDEIEVLMHKETVGMVDAFKKTFKNDTFGDDFEALVADARYKYINKYLSPLIKRKNAVKFAETKSDKLDKVFTHRFFGIPIFLLVLFSIFHITFGEDFLYLGKIFNLPSYDEVCKGNGFWAQILACVYDGAVFSPGVIFFNLIELLTSTLGDLISGLFVGSSEWVIGLISDGVLGGLFAILSFLPQILVLFLLFSILEDTGYMARIAFILDRMLRRFGLSGRAFLPMIMGFGCSVPAMINTRTLADEKERIATIRVIPFFSCGAKLPILTAIAGGIVTMSGSGSADIITYGMYVLGVIVAIMTLILMRSTTLKGDIPPFIMELPSYRAPQFKNLMLHLWDKAKHFIKKAFTIILASTIVIWAVSHFDFSWNFLTDEKIDQSILASLGKLATPLFTPLGFGLQVNGGLGWVFVVSIIAGLIAKENAIAVLATLSSCVLGGIVGDGDEMIISSFLSVANVGTPALLSFIAFNMTTIPCFATVATAKGELLNKKSFKFTLLFWIVVSYVTASTIYVVGTFPLSIAVYILIFVLVVTFLIIKSKKDKNKKLKGI